MRDIDDSQAEWAHEKGAIEQEVARDLSEPTYKFLTRLNEDLFAGTPYAHDALGTHDSFETTTGDMLKTFYKNWYAPNNAILVVSGDVDPAKTLALIKDLYGSIPRKPLPSRPEVILGPVKHETFTLDSNLPYVLAFLSYRLPGTESPDFFAARVLADVIASHRADLYALVPAGKALETSFELEETYPKASVGFAVGVLPAGADPSPVVTSMSDILSGYAKNGVPAELVEAVKRKEIADAAFERNSIPDLAATWSDALAAEGRTSPDEDVEGIRRVTVADVDRVAKQYLVENNSITATLVPKPSNEPVGSKGFGGGEQLTSAPTKPVTLPAWADAALSKLEIPHVNSTWTDTTLPNHIRLIVKSDKTSPTVTVLGNVRHEPHLQTPRGKDGVDDVLDELFSYGTTTLDRLAFQKALDDIAATEAAGYDFSVKVLKDQFSRGVELLADNVLRPALPDEAFTIVRKQTADFVEGQQKSPGYKAERAHARGVAAPRRSRPSGSDAGDDFVGDARRCETVSRVDIPSRPHDHRRHRRRHARGRADDDREMVWRVEGDRAQADAGSRHAFPPTMRRKRPSRIPRPCRHPSSCRKRSASHGSIRTTTRCNWGITCSAAVFTPHACITICARNTGTSTTWTTTSRRIEPEASTRSPTAAIRRTSQKRAT